MKYKDVKITKVIKLETFLHIEGLVNGKEQVVYIFLDSVRKLKSIEKCLLSEAKNSRPELFI